MRTLLTDAGRFETATGAAAGRQEKFNAANPRREMMQRLFILNVQYYNNYTFVDRQHGRSVRPVKRLGLVDIM